MKRDLQKNYEKGKEYLEKVAKENGWKYYDIVENSYEYKYGLTLIGYENEESQKGTTNDIIELGHVSINVENLNEGGKYD